MRPRACTDLSSMRLSRRQSAHSNWPQCRDERNRDASKSTSWNYFSSFVKWCPFDLKIGRMWRKEFFYKILSDSKSSRGALGSYRWKSEFRSQILSIFFGHVPNIPSLDDTCPCFKAFIRTYSYIGKFFLPSFYHAFIQAFMFIRRKYFRLFAAFFALQMQRSAFTLCAFCVRDSVLWNSG
jgi:hypothetical protein